MILNPHTGLPVEFGEVDPYRYQVLLQQAGLMGSGGTGENVGGERQRGASNAQRSANLASLGAFDPGVLQGMQTGTGRQDYNATDYLIDANGNLVASDTYEDRNNEREAAMGLAAFAALAGGATLAGIGQGGTATLGAGSLGTPIGTSAALPTLGTMATPTAASLGIGELAALGGGALGTMGTIAPSAATAASSALPTLGQAPAVSAATIGGTLPSLEQLTGGGSGLANLLPSGSGQYIAPAIGALVGGLDAAQGSQDTQTQQSRLDPNMQRLLYGDNGQGGLLNQANAFFQQNRGINPTAQQGLDMSKAFYTDPAYAQGYGQLRSQGLGLLSQPVAGNPFTRG